jgi:hypothetical protein
MKHVPAICLLAVPLFFAAAAPAEEPPLLQVKTGLSKIAETLKPAAAVEHNGRVLTMSYKTRTFMVHSSDKRGRHSKEAHETVGPRYDGLLVRVTQQDGPYAGAACVPQDLRKPYWATFVNAYPTAKGKQHLHAAISYGSRIDAALVREVKKLLDAVKDGARAPGQTVKDFVLALRDRNLEGIRNSMTPEFWKKNEKECKRALAETQESDRFHNIIRIDIKNETIRGTDASVNYEVLYLDSEEKTEKTWSNTARLELQGEKWLIRDL